MSQHLVGSAEIAKLLGVTRQRVAQLAASYEDFPEPEATLAAGRVWLTRDIEAWRAKHLLRPPGRPTTRLAEGVFSSFADDLKAALEGAQAIAMSLDHNLVGTPHLLLAMAEPGLVTAPTLASVGVRRDALRVLVEPLYAGARAHDGRFPFTPKAKESLDQALRNAFLLKDELVRLKHLLLAVCEVADRPLLALCDDLGTSAEAIYDATIEVIERELDPNARAHA